MSCHLLFSDILVAANSQIALKHPHKNTKHDRATEIDSL